LGIEAGGWGPRWRGHRRTDGISYPVKVQARTNKAAPKTKRSPKHGWMYRLLRFALVLVLALYGIAAIGVLALRWVNPPFTAVQIERRIQSSGQKTPYHKRYTFVALGRISLDFQHAVIAAEDSRFYQHHGFDWEEVHHAIEEEREDGRLRGASTITQQLVKNLFLSTSRSIVRKGVEFTLVPLAEHILDKRRILELYLNVIEWGPGVYGAESAAQAYYGIPAARVNREQGARLAAILPSPLRRRPARMNDYSAVILERMGKMGW
jgi:monofunctional biosynthetic peptidoglycan transglycosylase